MIEIACYVPFKLNKFILFSSKRRSLYYFWNHILLSQTRFSAHEINPRTENKWEYNHSNPTTSYMLVTISVGILITRIFVKNHLMKCAFNVQDGYYENHLVVC